MIIIPKNSEEGDVMVTIAGSSEARESDKATVRREAGQPVTSEAR